MPLLPHLPQFAGDIDSFVGLWLHVPRVRFAPAMKLCLHRIHQALCNETASGAINMFVTIAALLCYVVTQWCNQLQRLFGTRHCNV